MKCYVCTLDKTSDQMHPDKRRNSVFEISTICENCFQEKQRERKRLDKLKYRRDPTKNITLKYRKWSLTRKYKLSEKEFEEIFAKQGYCCAACGSKTSRWTKGWCIDHNHSCCIITPTCGKCTRGILCMPCNMAAGVMKDNIKDLKALINYLDNKQDPKRPGILPA